jgi:hypothetical protein
MIPPFLDNGLLPEGIHWASLTEIETRYAINDHRQRLTVGMRSGILALIAAGCRKVYLDGSFVTAKEFPSDYDACWEITGVRITELDKVFLEFGHRRAAQKTKFMGEFFPACLPAESTSPYRTFLNFFQTDKDTGARKGIIGIDLAQNI